MKGNKMIIIGLGSGRSGTASLAKLINSQQNTICFHELNPSCICWENTPQPIENTIIEFSKILAGGASKKLTVDFTRESSVKKFKELVAQNEVTNIGDIAHYYLYYVDDILKLNIPVKFICTKRNKESTVNSWLRKSKKFNSRSQWIAEYIRCFLTKEPFTKYYNHWQHHDGRKWFTDPLWDKCFPKFEATSRRQAIEKYWTAYYKSAHEYEEKHPNNFKVFDVEDFNSTDGQNRILEFLNIEQSRRVITPVRENITQST